MRISKSNMYSFIGGLLVAMLINATYTTMTAEKEVKKENDEEMVMLKEPGQVIPVKEMEVESVQPDGNALVTSNDIENIGMKMILQPIEGAPFYDDMVIRTEKNQVVRQVGTKSIRKFKHLKTIPVVKIMDK